MQKAISFEVTAIAQYIYQNNTPAIKERPKETSCFLIFMDTQQNKNCSKVLSQHGTELWMPDFLIILFFGPSVMLTTDCKKWHIFRQICILMKFDHIWPESPKLCSKVSKITSCSKKNVVAGKICYMKSGLLYYLGVVKNQKSWILN